ncbi:MAG: SGNH/GDSL hydrolase family protein [Candidatus Parabeggiatoa sp.]|nr:SGNH/GDSL hydrolase family protein [Candidatus Parabeggiatoa sp.]
MRANKFANFVLIIGILFFLLALIDDLYRIIISSSLDKHRFIFAVIPIAGVVICSLALRLRQDYKINLVLIGLSIFVAVYSVEIFLFYQKTDIRQRIAQKMEMPFDTRSKREIIKEMKEQGVESFPSFYTHLIIPTNGLEINGKSVFPLGGVSQKTTVLCNESGKWVIYKSDEHGFNNPSGLFEVEGIDIVLLGDSFTHGLCVRQGEDIASQLRRVSGRQVINLGNGGNGPLIELASLKEYAEPLKPKYVLWLYYEGNDLADLVSEQKSPFLLKYRHHPFSQGLINRQSEIDSVLIKSMDKIAGETVVDHVIKVLKLWHLRLLLFRPSVPTLFTELLQNAKNLTASWGGKLYFVYLPAWNRYAMDLEQGTFYHRHQVLSIVQGLNIPIIDLHEKVFATHPDPQSLFPFRVFGHYTSEGYSLVAQAIQASLKKDGFLKQEKVR